MTPADTTTRAMALNCAQWTESSLRALGIRVFRSESLWWREAGGSPIYLAALIFDGGATRARVVGELAEAHRGGGISSGVLYDCFAKLDLRAAGYDRCFQNPWYWRAAGEIAPRRLPTGLSIEVARSLDELAEFECATALGFEQGVPPRFSQHAAATLDDPGMYYLNARLDGDVVASAIAHATDDMLGIYGISTLPAFRRRGYGTALVHASVALRPELPVSVFPDPPSVPMYACHGFARGGEIAVWGNASSRS